MGAYTQMLHPVQGQRVPVNTVDVYVAASETAQVSQSQAIQRPPFLLKFVKMGEKDGKSTNVGSVHSASFKGKSASQLPLSELRKLIGMM